MTDLLDIATRLEAAMTFEGPATTPRLAVAMDHLMDVAKEAVEAMQWAAVPRPIQNAPDNDGWVLAYIPGRSEKLPPWALATRCDGGWCDEEGYGVDPTMWVPLPDPQPAPTGWRKAEGAIRIIKAWSEQIPWLSHLVEIIKPDGDVDSSREPDMASTIEDARQRAATRAVELGLPIEEVEDGNVLPFRRKEPTH
ncbi:hypothetical protein [Sphingobium yanoikuyae]|uniref:DUF551 domain-containing protein n=1 Tax=Sphingobium yanoikuyae TaxID=13690 RepID=A0A0J9D167_SPHYA|nr:hypothetical protein [Sphingobium yanoikuyae]ATP20782.1 hypothetical protein BV87_21975 [Sphingobium yanoikuyae]KMW31132.1 hypothetical protein BV87_02830 [Sphingobium yanoikuyae]